jgi:tetratricopeptide (TPR) repeat protein
MKAERRHELQHNELADWVAEAIERIKPYSRAIVGVAVAAAVLLTTYVVLSGRAERKQSTAWTDYYLAIQGPPDSVEADLEAVIREHEGVAAGQWAQVALADLKLGEGIKALFTDKAAAQKNLESAVEYYEAVIPEAEDPLLVARARFGLARALESQGRLDKAREVYEQIVEASGTNAYVSLAESRLKDLKRDSTKDFYAWFEQQEPVAMPPASASSLPGTPGEKLPFDASFLDSPGSLNLSGQNILNIPELDKGAGPLLTPPTESDADKGAVEPTKDAESDAGKEDAAKESESTEKGETKANVKDGAATSKDESQAAGEKSEGTKSDAAKDEDGKSDASPDGGAKHDSEEKDQSSGKTP